MSTRLDGMVVVVTGACGGIGRAVRDQLHQLGAVAIGSDVLSEPDHPPHAADDTGGYIACDVRSRPQVEALVARALERHGRIDGLVLAAGIAGWAPALEVDPAEWDDVIAVNLTGAFTTAQAVARAMRDADRPGAMVFIGSWLAESTLPRLLPYCVSKAGLEMAARGLALELAPHRIRVNVVAPGIIDAGISSRVFDRVPGRRELMAQAVPLGRLGTPAQVAACVAMLLSEASAYVTGSTLVVDGGIRLVHGSG